MDKIQEGNKIIAIFDGWEFHPGNPNHHCDRHYYNLPDEGCSCHKKYDTFTYPGSDKIRYIDSFNYDKSFDEIMRVWEKIESLGYDTAICGIEIKGARLTEVMISPVRKHPKIDMEIHMRDDKSKVLLMREAAIQFITWYNLQPK
jgi:hypothetical protein